MDKFDISVSLLISATVGAGVFAMPILAKEVGLMSVFVITLAFAYMLGLGYLIIELFPGTVEEEVERTLGERGRQILVIAEISIVLLALVSYAFGLKVHLGVSDLVLLSILLIPLLLELHFPANFTTFVAFFTLAFVSLLSLVTIPQMELPIHLFITSSVRDTALSTGAAAAAAPPLMGYASVIPLLLVSLFAFYGHNMIPRIRNIMRNKIATKKVFYMALAIVFLLYLPFTISVSGVGVSELATKFLAEMFTNPLASLIDLFAVIIFYTSFIIFGLHLMNDFTNKQKGLGLVVGGTFILYFFASLLGAPFHVLIAAAGLGVTIYAFLVALSAFLSKKLFPVPQLIMGLTGLMWLILLIQLL